MTKFCLFIENCTTPEAIIKNPLDKKFRDALLHFLTNFFGADAEINFHKKPCFVSWIVWLIWVQMGEIDLRNRVPGRARKRYLEETSGGQPKSSSSQFAFGV